MKRISHTNHSHLRSMIAAVLALVCFVTPLFTSSVFADSWYCPNCGRYNDSNFCPKDGTKQPTGVGSNSSKRSQRTVYIGDSITLGAYEQNNRRSKEPIEWIVLDTSGDYALVVSRYGLEALQPYHNRYSACTWETSSVRKWLNNDFLDNAFTASEEKCILETRVCNDKFQGNPNWSQTGGNNTTDRIFLLSYAEAKYYFQTNKDRRCAPTDYAYSQGAWTYDKESPEGKLAGMWWLRSPGETAYSAASVDINGSVNWQNDVNTTFICIRPAMWVDVSKLP